jgi:competence protein ComEC
MCLVWHSRGMKKFYTLCAIAFFTIFSVRELWIAAQLTTTVRICDTDQGDAIIIRTPSKKVIVVDGGPNMDILTDLGELLPWFKRSIDVLVVTHPDLDHITALPSILRRYSVKSVLLTGIEGNSGRYNEFLHLVQQYKIPILTPDTTRLIDFNDGAKLRVLWPQSDMFGSIQAEPNDTSVVLRVEHNARSILLTGDIGKEAETALLATGVNIESTYLKAAHHGSKTSSSTGIILATNPQLAIISAGKDNRFHHPHEEVVKRYKNMQIPLWNTAYDGDFTAVLR